MERCDNMKLSRANLEIHLKNVVRECYNNYPFLHSESLQTLTQKTLDKYLDSGLPRKEIETRIFNEFDEKRRIFKARQENVNNIVQQVEAKQQLKTEQQNEEEEKKELKRIDEEIKRSKEEEALNNRLYQTKLNEEEIERRKLIDQAFNIEKIEEEEKKKDIRLYNELKKVTLSEETNDSNSNNDLIDRRMQEISNEDEENEKKLVKDSNSQKGVVSLFSISLMILSAIAFVIIAMILNVLLK